jgi:glycosyltransferase involved in cell wall biosynthesis
VTAGSDRPIRRAVVLVGTPAAPYSRGLRIARALAASGFDVEIAAVAVDGVPDLETDGAITIRRYRPSGPLASMAATHRSAEVRPAAVPGGEPVRLSMAARIRRLARIHRLGRAAASIRRWVFWPHTVRAWWTTLAEDLEPADLYHACGSLAVSAALAARGRDRRAGRTSRVVYDAIDDVAAGNNELGMPGPVRSMIRMRERRWARAADARITVNDALADALAGRWGTPRPVVVPNWPETTLAPDAPPSNRIRETTEISAATRVVLFQGRLGPNLGLDEAAEAVLRVENAALVLIGFGRGEARSQARDRDPRYAGRHVTLPAVHPDDLLPWTASADVAIVPLPPVSANQRASTPNKFWEAIAAGTPLVIGPGLPVMAALVRAHDLGVVAASLAPDDLAAAIRVVLDVPPEVALERRRRIAAVAREEFSWQAASDRYRALVRAIAGPP